MEEKKSFREICLKKLKKAQIRGSYVKDKMLISRIERYLKDNNAQYILLYLPLKMEVNLYPLIRKLRREKKIIYVPFMEGASFRLVKYRLPLKKKQFGIKEPYDSKQYRNKKIDVAIVPIVGVDSTLRRLGFGKGMYDRFFEKEYKNINRVVFVARELCYSKKVITNHYDVRADNIITP